MATDLRRILVVDIEATCWKTKEEQGSQPNEILEIGVTEVTSGKGITNVVSYMVKPRSTKVSAFCTELTGWSQADADEGLDIAEALQEIQTEFKLTDNFIWASYGEYDRRMLSEKVFQLYGITRAANPFARARTHLNVKTLFALRHRLPREIGMDRALQQLGIPLEGRHHNGADDSKNIAKILLHVLS